MRKQNDRLLFSPSDLIKFMGSPFDSWMDRYHLEYPGLVTPDETAADVKLTQRKGLEHEYEFLAALKAEGRTVYEVTSKEEIGAAETVKAITEGHDVVYQGALFLGDFGGYSDFLVRVEKPSLLGDFQYEVWDTKLANHAKPYFLVQLLCYSEIMETLQGVFPEVMQVVLGNKERAAFRTADFRYLYQQLKTQFLEFQRTFNPDNRPDPVGTEGYGRWASVAEAWLEEVDHLSRIANIRKTQISKLNGAGIKTLTQLAQSDVTHIEKLDPATLLTLKQQAALQLHTAAEGTTQYQVIPPSAETPRSGLALLPPASRLDVCFDMEGFPYFDGGLEYLFGVVYEEGASLKFEDWWAHCAREEKAAFEAFVDWVYARWQEDPNMHIYHYGHYEVTRLQKLMGKYGSRENQVDVLLRSQVFVDLFKMVRNSVRIGEPSYSIKYVEHLYKSARSGAVSTAVDSVVQYQNWLDAKDGDDYRTSNILKGIRDYNEEDCVSTWELVQWLRKIQTESNQPFIPLPPTARPDDEDEQGEKEARAAQQSRARASQLAQELLTEAESETEPGRVRLLELFAWLLEFHWREARPIFWKMYARHDMTDEQLYDDIDCLAGLTRTETAPTRPARAKSSIYEYRFNPDQETKLTRGKPCFFSHNLKLACEVNDIDLDEGLVTLKISDKLEAPDKLNIIPNEYIAATAIADSIYRTVVRWRASGVLPSAFSDFIYRNPPVLSAGSLSDDVVDVIAHMHNTTLCIQGPPGAGKTYQASRAIVNLLRSGKTVGIASNGHKAVTHLMKQVAELARKTGVNFRGVKIKKDEEGALDAFSSIVSAKSGKDVFDKVELGFNLIGGSAWAFSIESAADKLDYLFVDEAGQVSIANLMGIAPCARNLVLMGDQMQLSQPIQGSHPGESGKSTLEYLLQEQATIPAHFGVFLGTTFRMHPDLCEFISDSVYEGRLRSDTKTRERVLSLPEMTTSTLQKTSGLMYVPVEHEGNTQSSDEEAQCIKTLVEDLLRCRRYDEQKKSWVAVELCDILIVAPYNMQVRKIKTLLPDAKVGSVDKFQGQECPIVIVSMCTSDGESSPRGLEFLFNKNRLNVAISRAQTLAIVVGSPRLALSRCSSVEQMQLVNLYCRIVQEGATDSPRSRIKQPV